MNLGIRQTSCVLVIQTANSNPTLSCQGRKLTRSIPMRFGMKYTIPTHAILFGTRDEIVTLVNIATISNIPGTEARSVVCSVL